MCILWINYLFRIRSTICDGVISFLLDNFACELHVELEYFLVDRSSVLHTFFLLGSGSVR